MKLSKKEAKELLNNLWLPGEVFLWALFEIRTQFLHNCRMCWFVDIFCS
jgi:hypothetical protein